MPAKYVVQMSKENGDPYLIMDKTARTMVNNEVTAREAADAAEAEARAAAVNDLKSIVNKSVIRVSDIAINGKYIDSNGDIVDGYYRAYCYIPYTSGSLFVSIPNNEGDIIVKFWDEDKTEMLGGVGTSWTGARLIYEDSIAEGTKFISISLFRSDVEKAFVYVNEPVYGHVAEEYVKTAKVQMLDTVEDAIKGTYINSQGTKQASAIYSYKYFPYENGPVILYGANNEGIIKFWNEDKTEMLGGIGTTWTDINRTITESEIPSGTKFISLSFYNSDIDKIRVCVGILAETVHKTETSENITGEIKQKLQKARYTDQGVTPLTILHFSDIHGDKAALRRIMDQAESYGNLVDDIICTGDFVPNTWQEIESWWNPRAMVVIGNHDTASYNNGTYNWTYLTMAERVEYYLEPFESEWDIVRETGKSYYYKDYADANVRMICIDYMTYWQDQSSTESNAQTTWLQNTLADAIENELHVLIAIHGPVKDTSQGAQLDAVDCSFTKYGLTQSDSNALAFSAIVSSVLTAINNGLNFIGYICGHLHWDAVYITPDEKQLEFAAATANVTQRSQWNGFDLFKGTEADAYNLVTIDTTRKLVKLIRGGGADMDGHMRQRKSICFDYNTNTIITEEN